MATNTKMATNTNTNPAHDDRTRVMEIVWSRMADQMQHLYGIHTSEHAVAPEGERKE